MTRWISPEAFAWLAGAAVVVAVLVALLVLGKEKSSELDGDAGYVLGPVGCRACGGQDITDCGCLPDDDGDDHEDVDADVLPFSVGRCPTCRRWNRPVSCCRRERLAAALRSRGLDSVTRAHLSDAIARATERKPTLEEVESAYRRWGA